MTIPDGASPPISDPAMRSYVDLYVTVTRVSERLTNLIDLVKADQKERAAERREDLKRSEDHETRIAGLENSKLVLETRIQFLLWLGSGAFAIVLALLGAGYFLGLG